MLLALWSGFWDWGGDTPSEPTRGGVADYRAYRKKLKRIAAAADRRLYKKTIQRVEVLAKQEMPPVIERKVKAIELDLEAILENANEAQHALLIEQIKKLDLLIESLIVKRQREEEEAILVLLMA